MGIRHLNKYFMQKCKKECIRKIALSELAGKTIVIDTSIYLYKFAGQNSLQESIFHMITLFHKYSIVPIFVFDGKPPPEKYDEISRRKWNKYCAEEKYDKMSALLEETTNEKERQTILHGMESLKQQFVRISNKDIKNVKTIMDAYGVTYYDARGEADKLCATISKQQNCMGCLSDDMDMFVYGCRFVLRHLSLYNETLLLYDFEKIMRDLNMSHAMFKQVAILSGTDYNIQDNCITLHETMKWYYQYRKSHCNDCIDEENETGFYKWLQDHTKYIKNYESLMNIHQLFIVKEEDKNSELYKGTIDKNYDNKKLQRIMKEYKFAFV